MSLTEHFVGQMREEVKTCLRFVMEIHLHSVQDIFIYPLPEYFRQYEEVSAILVGVLSISCNSTR